MRRFQAIRSIAPKCCTLNKNKLLHIDGKLHKATRLASSKIDQLFKHVATKTDDITNKVTVVGTGQVGMACVITLLAQSVTNDVAMVDLSKEKMTGEMLDLQHGTIFLRNAKIHSSTDFSVAEGSRLCIITAGLRQEKGETRLDLLQKNAEMYKKIIPQLVKQCPSAVFLIASNPVDILSWVTWKLSGLPVHRVIGSGTNLDTARFRFLLSERLKVASTSVHGFVIGEHGDSQVPVWSSLNIAGVRLRDMYPKIGRPDDPEKWNEVHKKVVNSAAEVIGLKGFTSWAIGLSLTQITRAILTNTHSVHAVSTHVKNQHGIEQDVFLSLPCVIGDSGAVDIVHMQLAPEEKKMLQHSASVLYKAQSTIKL